MTVYVKACFYIRMSTKKKQKKKLPRHIPPTVDLITCHDVSQLYLRLPTLPAEPLLSWKAGLETTCSPDIPPAHRCAAIFAPRPDYLERVDYLVCLWNYDGVEQLRTARVPSDVSILLSSGFLPLPAGRKGQEKICCTYAQQEHMSFLRGSYQRKWFAINYH